MRRRTTLALVAGGATVAAAGGAIVGGRLRNYRPEHDASNPEGRTMEAESWYLENKPKIMRQVRSFLRPFRKPLAAAYGKEGGGGDRQGRDPALRGPAAGHPVHRWWREPIHEGPL